MKKFGTIEDDGYDDKGGKYIWSFVLRKIH